MADSGEMWLLFDGDCGFCQRWVNWARKRGAERHVQFQPCQHAVDLRAQAAIAIEECGHSAILVKSGQRGLEVHRAAAAINGVLRTLPGGRNFFLRSISHLYSVPGIKQIEEIGYRWIARNRHRFPGDSCRVNGTADERR
jgi:predicted DCC family thiol-disulfide oxidoreductase YuxK